MRNIYIWFFFYTTVEYERIIGYTKILRQYWGFFDWTHIICNYKHKTFTPLALVSISRPRKSKLRHPYQRHYRLDRPFTRTVAGVTNDVRKRGWTERGEWLSVHYFDHLFTLAVARVTTCRRGWTKEERKRKYQQEIPHDPQHKRSRVTVGTERKLPRDKAKKADTANNNMAMSGGRHYSGRY